MISILTHEKKEVIKGNLGDIKKKHLSLIDVVNPSLKDLEMISEYTSVPLKNFRRFLSKLDERSSISNDSDYSMIVFKVPYHSSKGFTVKSLRIIVMPKSNNLIVLRNFDFSSISNLEHLPKDIKMEVFKNLDSLVYRLLEEIYDSYFKIIESLEDDVESLESKVFVNPSEDNIRKIFHMKKTLVYLNKALNQNRDVLAEIENGYLKHLNIQKNEGFHNLYNDSIQLVDIISTYRDLLQGSVDIYLTQVSNKLNISMKNMTVWASFVMVPTLIAGIYGMNFKFMPELNWYWGYPFVIFLMVLSIIGLYYLFKKKGYI